eukprot:1313138-Prymnesium_polylepis.1
MGVPKGADRRGRVARSMSGRRRVAGGLNPPADVDRGLDGPACRAARRGMAHAYGHHPSPPAAPRLDMDEPT